MRVLKMGIVVACLLLLVCSFAPDEKPWNIPAEYLSKTNPYEVSNQEMVKVGKMQYARHCKSCHGNLGQGNGPKARSLEADIEDFTTAEFQNQKDGVLYYQSFVGRDEMPNFEKKIVDDEDRWALITYLRTLKKCK